MLVAGICCRMRYEVVRDDEDQDKQRGGTTIGARVSVSECGVSEGATRGRGTTASQRSIRGLDAGVALFLSLSSHQSIRSLFYPENFRPYASSPGFTSPVVVCACLHLFICLVK